MPKPVLKPKLRKPSLTTSASALSKGFTNPAKNPAMKVVQNPRGRAIDNKKTYEPSAYQVRKKIK